MNSNLLILFFKNPESGKVKTRLARDLGDDFAIQLYMQFLTDVLDVSRKVSAEVMIASTVPLKGSEPFFSGHRPYPFFLQEGEDLGARMYNALRKGFTFGYERCVLVGGDIPDLTYKIINDSFLSLLESDVVLGPTIDGGYYLIGCTGDGLDSSFFENIAWSTMNVFAMTREKVSQKNKSCSLLSPLNDIDTVGDLRVFYEKKRSILNHTNTMKFLSLYENVLYGKI